jgi:hypothetical protein
MKIQQIYTKVDNNSPHPFPHNLAATTLSQIQGLFMYEVIEDVAAQAGIFLTLEPPTHEMVSEAASAGTFHSGLWDNDYPHNQILSIEELLV